MKTIKQRFNILASLVFLLMLLCTSLDNPFQDTDNVSLKINVPEKEGGFNYCVNDKVIFEVTVIMPHLVKKISIIYDEDGNRDDQEITTNESDNKKISFSYIYWLVRPQVTT